LKALLLVDIVPTIVLLNTELPIMKHYLILLISLILTSQLSAQSDQQLSRYLKQNPAADANGNGKLTSEEARKHRQTNRRPQKADPSEGDNLAAQSHISGIDIPESISPVKEVKLKSSDGVDLNKITI